MADWKNSLYYGDNLPILKEYLAAEQVDLIYLDPPFNSNRNYSVIFSKNGKTEDENKAQIEAFEDTWHWTHITAAQYEEFPCSQAAAGLPRQVLHSRLPEYNNGQILK